MASALYHGVGKARHHLNVDGVGAYDHIAQAAVSKARGPARLLFRWLAMRIPVL